MDTDEKSRHVSNRGATKSIEKKHSTIENPIPSKNVTKQMRSDSMPIVSSSKEDYVEKEAIKKQSTTETYSTPTPTGENTPKTKSGSGKAKKKVRIN